MATCIYGIASSESKANDIVSSLKTSGLTDTDITVLRPEKPDVTQPAKDQTVKSAEAVSACSGSKGAAGMGVPEADVRRYEGKVKGGSTFISVHSDNADHMTKARDIFEKAGATDIGDGKPTANGNRAEKTDKATTTPPATNGYTFKGAGVPPMPAPAALRAPSSR